MKKLICVFLILSLCNISFAGKKSKKPRVPERWEVMQKAKAAKDIIAKEKGYFGADWYRYGFDSEKAYDTWLYRSAGQGWTQSDGTNYGAVFNK